MFRTTTIVIVLGALLALPPMHGIADACGVKVSLRAPRTKSRLSRRVAPRERRVPIATSSGTSERVLARSGGFRDRRAVRSSSTLARRSTRVAARIKPQATLNRRLPQRGTSSAGTSVVAKASPPKNSVTKTRVTKTRVTKTRSVAPRNVARAFQVELFFDMGKATIESSELDTVVAWLKSHPNARLVIEGHTDASGSAAFNRRLSVQRAKAVRSLLVDRSDASMDRIRVVGFGESRLADPEDASKNRRVVIGAR